jgi:hypothetical protein
VELEQVEKSNGPKVEKLKPLTARELMAASPPWRDVECVAWGGLVRIARLDPVSKLRLALQASTLNKGDEGKISMLEEANWGFAVQLVAACVIDEQGTLQFAEPGPRAWLAGEISAVSQLLSECMALNRLGGAEVDADAEETKKN